MKEEIKLITIEPNYSYKELTKNVKNYIKDGYLLDEHNIEEIIKQLKKNDKLAFNAMFKKINPTVLRNNHSIGLLYSSKNKVSTVQEYLEGSRNPELTKEQEKELFDKIRAGDKAEEKLVKNTNLTQEEIDALNMQIKAKNKAYNELYEATRLLIYKIAKDEYNNNKSLSMERLISAGTNRFHTAVERFDSSKNNKFSTYATYWIRQGVLQELKDKSRVIRLPVNIHDRVVRLKKYKAMFAKDLKREPTLQELADKMSEHEKDFQNPHTFTPLEIVELFGYAHNVQSLDKACEDGDDDDTIVALIESEDELTPVEVDKKDKAIQELDDFLQNYLSDKEILYIIYTYGIFLYDDETKLLQRDLAKKLDMSTARFKQFESNLNKKLANISSHMPISAYTLLS